MSRRVKTARSAVAAATALLLSLLVVPAPAQASVPADDALPSIGAVQTAIDQQNHWLFAAEAGYNRVAVYQLTSSNGISSHTPIYALGQPDLDSNASAVSSSGMHHPSGVAYEASTHHLFVADQFNNRVLVFNTAAIATGMAAFAVIGQPDFTSSSSSQTQGTLNSPVQLTIDTTRHYLFVADQTNHRVLLFDTTTVATGELASYVLGSTSFSSGSSGTTQSTFNYASGVAYDNTRQMLYVSEFGNNRVTIFDLTTLSNGPSAVHVLGQTDFTSSAQATTQTGFHAASAVAVDTVNQRLFVADVYNERVMVFEVATITDGEPAVGVLGQPNFTSSGSGSSLDQMYDPYGIAYDEASSQLFVGDTENNRVLVFDESVVGSTTTVTMVVDPTLTFVVGPHSSSCDGVAQSSGSSASATAISLGHVNASTNGVAAQDLSVTTNAPLGFTVFLRNNAQMNDGAGHTIADVSGDNTSPASGPVAGTPAFGYTTSETGLGTGTADRFTNGGAKWAKVTNSNSEVSYAATGPATNDTVCVAYQLAVGPTTPAGTYATTVVYTAVPKY